MKTSVNKILLFCILGKLFLVFSLIFSILAHFIMPELDSIRDPLSFYSNGRYGIVQNVGFAFLGMSFLMLFLLIKSNFQNSKIRNTSLSLILFSGSGNFLLTLFKDNQGSDFGIIEDKIHDISAAIFLASSTILGFLMLKILKKDLFSKKYILKIKYISYLVLILLLIHTLLLPYRNLIDFWPIFQRALFLTISFLIWNIFLLIYRKECGKVNKIQNEKNNINKSKQKL